MKVGTIFISLLMGQVMTLSEDEVEDFAEDLKKIIRASEKLKNETEIKTKEKVELQSETKKLITEKNNLENKINHLNEEVKNLDDLKKENLDLGRKIRQMFDNNSKLEKDANASTKHIDEINIKLIQLKLERDTLTEDNKKLKEGNLEFCDKTFELAAMISPMIAIMILVVIVIGQHFTLQYKKGECHAHTKSQLVPEGVKPKEPSFNKDCSDDAEKVSINKGLDVLSSDEDEAESDNNDQTVAKDIVYKYKKDEPKCIVLLKDCESHFMNYKTLLHPGQNLDLKFWDITDQLVITNLQMQSSIDEQGVSSVTVKVSHAKASLPSDTMSDLKKEKEREQGEGPKSHSSVIATAFKNLKTWSSQNELEESSTTFNVM